MTQANDAFEATSRKDRKDTIRSVTNRLRSVLRDHADGKPVIAEMAARIDAKARERGIIGTPQDLGEYESPLA